MHFRRLHLALAILLLAALPLSAQVQKAAEAWTEWETISPGERRVHRLDAEEPDHRVNHVPVSQDGAERAVVSCKIIRWTSCSRWLR